jgi:hypothetical protein
VEAGRPSVNLEALAKKIIFFEGASTSHRHTKKIGWMAMVN